jgi:hypothetical protein
MPAQQRRGCHDEAGPAVTTNGASQRAEQRAIVRFEPRASDLAPQHGELVAQHQDLGVLGAIPSAA